MLEGLVLAAGEGERLKNVNPGNPKSMLPILGIPLIEHQLRILEWVGFTHVALIIRETHQVTLEHLNRLEFKFQLDIVTRNTQGGMYSLFELAHKVNSGTDFFLFTVDNIFNPVILKSFIEQRQGKKDPDIVTWATRRGNDLSSVGIRLDNCRVLEFGKHLLSTQFIAEGPFHCQISVLNNAFQMQAQKSEIVSLSSYFSFLIAQGLAMQVFFIDDVVLDIDTKDDIEKAQQLICKLQEEGKWLNYHSSKYP